VLHTPCTLLDVAFTNLHAEGAELVDSVLDVVRKEAEGTDCLQGECHYLGSFVPSRAEVMYRFPNYLLA
jgi:hypothetical protein